MQAGALGKTYKNGEIIVRQGETGDSMYIIQDGQVEVVDCQFASRIATGLTGTVNGNVTCPCGYPVPVEETTWGRVKSLYIE